MRRAITAIIAGAILGLIALPTNVGAAPSIPSVVSHDIQSSYPAGSVADPTIVVEGKERGGFVYQYLICDGWVSQIGQTKKDHADPGDPVLLPPNFIRDCTWNVYYAHGGKNFQLTPLLTVPFTITV